MTWVVGFALIADLYESNERGRVTGFVMMGTSCAIMVGPTIGGWLYEIGGMRAPFVTVAVLAAMVLALFLWYEVPDHHVAGEVVPIGLVVRVPAIAACTMVVIAISATISMLEPVLSLVRPTQQRTRTDAWRPWRAYAAMHLWNEVTDRMGATRGG